MESREALSDFPPGGSSLGPAVWVAGSGFTLSVPVTMSASQSPRPPGAASTAVWGLYTCVDLAKDGVPYLLRAVHLCLRARGVTGFVVAYLLGREI